MAASRVEMFRGDNHEINLVVKDTDGVVVDITGARIIFTAATLPTQLQKDSDNGAAEVELTDPANGEAQIKIVPIDTKGTTPLQVGSYQFDIEMQLSGKTHTLVKGFFQLQADVT